MNYKIKRNKYIVLKLLERAKANANKEIVISNEEFNYLKENFDNSLVCEPIIEGYYWYAGQDHPSTNNNIVDDNVSPGWRLTGTTIDADYEFNTTDNGISDNPTRREEWYIALPVGSPYHIWDDAYTEQFDTYYIIDETVEFNNVTYNIYKTGISARILGGQLIKK